MSTKSMDRIMDFGLLAVPLLFILDWSFIGPKIYTPTKYLFSQFDKARRGRMKF